MSMDSHRKNQTIIIVIIRSSPKPEIDISASRASEIHCGPAKLHFGWPDWPAREKLSMTPVNVVYCQWIKVTNTLAISLE